MDTRAIRTQNHSFPFRSSSKILRLPRTLSFRTVDILRARRNSGRRCTGTAYSSRSNILPSSSKSTTWQFGDDRKSTNALDSRAGSGSTKVRARVRIAFGVSFIAISISGSDSNFPRVQRPSLGQLVILNVSKRVPRLIACAILHGATPYPHHFACGT